MTTTASINFDQPTLFKEGRFAREEAQPPSPEKARPLPPFDRDRSVTGPRPAADSSAALLAAPADRDRVTLDDLLSSVWAGLAAHREVTCPVCRGSMAPRYGSGAQPVGGRCRRCGSTLG
jgi:hypothetical protein